MRLPGFGAESALYKTSRYYQMEGGPAYSAEGSPIIPALPLGGYRCLAEAAACRDGVKFACQALSKCNARVSGEGGECHVSGGGGCIASNCDKTGCWCVAYGPPAQSVTCCYAGDCSTFW
jgi:hypothetical protein